MIQLFEDRHEGPDIERRFPHAEHSGWADKTEALKAKSCTVKSIY